MTDHASLIARERVEKMLAKSERAFADLPNGAWATECYLSPQATKDIRCVLRALQDQEPQG